MIIHSNTKSKIQEQLVEARSVWIATAMISNQGWSFLQNNLTADVTQFYLIGVDLATDPKVFEAILKNMAINARVYQTQYTFHPKVYLIQKIDKSFTAFIGSSNTTTWGLEKNIEMNFQIIDQNECKKILAWFEGLYRDGYLITPEYVSDYKSKYVSAEKVVKVVEKDAIDIKATLTKNDGQFFSKNQHEIFNERFHRIENYDLKEIRKEVREKFLALHRSIYKLFFVLWTKRLT